MDPVIVAAAARVVGFFKPLVLQGAEEFAKKIGVAAVDKISGLLKALRKRWTDDPEASQALDRFEREPEVEQHVLESTLADRLSRDDELATLVQDAMKDIGPTLVITMRAGEVDVQDGPEIGNIRRGRVNIEQTLTKGKKQTGPKIADVG